MSSTKDFHTELMMKFHNRGKEATTEMQATFDREGLSGEFYKLLEKKIVSSGAVQTVIAMEKPLQRVLDEK